MLKRKAPRRRLRRPAHNGAKSGVDSARNGAKSGAHIERSGVLRGAKAELSDVSSDVAPPRVRQAHRSKR